MRGNQTARVLPEGPQGRPESACSIAYLDAGFFIFPGGESGRMKKSLNFFQNEPKAWPNMRKEFFLDNPYDAWDVVRDFLRGESARSCTAHGKENLGVN